MTANVEAIRVRVLEARTHYDALDVPPGADEGTIKTAHRGLAKLFHPDRPQGAKHTDVMAAVNVAYNVLTDAPARKKYDALHKTKEERCLHCKGTGKAHRQKSFNKRVEVPCPACGGTGVCRA